MLLGYAWSLFGTVGGKKRDGTRCLVAGMRARVETRRRVRLNEGQQ
jgi:hypothetical protein